MHIHFLKLSLWPVGKKPWFKLNAEHSCEQFQISSEVNWTMVKGVKREPDTQVPQAATYSLSKTGMSGEARGADIWPGKGEQEAWRSKEEEAEAEEEGSLVTRLLDLSSIHGLQYLRPPQRGAFPG